MDLADHPAPGRPILTLATHAHYQCAHRGACCRSHWGIPASSLEYQQWLREEADGRLTLDARAGARGTLRLPPGAIGTVVIPTHQGTCVFYSVDSARCTIHRDLGETRLPTACRHFPRVCRLDADATRVSFSHYCPTVAATLLDEPHQPLSVVPNPPSCPPHTVREGLDTGPAGAPLLHPAMSLDHESYVHIERAIIETLTRGGAAERALATLRVQVERLRLWKPGRMSLMEATVTAFSEPPAFAIDPTEHDEAVFEMATLHPRELEWFNEAVRSVPPLVRRPRLADVEGRDFTHWVAPAWAELNEPVARYLAARAFGNWTAYLGCGLRTVLRALDVALAAVKVELARAASQDARLATRDHLIAAVGQADLLLVHLADPRALARLWSEAERTEPRAVTGGRRRRQPLTR